MSRPLRNNVVGGWYHVTSRGHNRRHQQCGSLYQGRFKAVLVEGGGWLLRLSQYIHYNPVAIQGLGMGKREKGAEQKGWRTPTREQAQRGDWDFRLKAVYTIGILDFVFDEDKDTDQYLYDVKLTKQETGTVFCDKLNFIYIEVPKFNKTEEELETHFDKWLFAIKNLYRLDAIPGKLKEQVFERFFEIAEIASMNPEERFSYESSLKYYRDMKNVIDTAKGEGWEEGRQEGMQQGEAKTLLKILEKRFGQVPAAVIKQMQAADTSQLEAWIDASLDAASLQEIFRD
jgi:hypothetical protein